MERARDSRGRLRSVYTNDEIRDARRRVRAGDSLRKVALDLGMGKQGHANLGRRIRALDAQDAARARTRADARSARQDVPEVATGNRPEALPGERVLLAADVQLPVRYHEPIRPVPAEPAPEVSDAEYRAQLHEAVDVRLGYRTPQEVRAARAQGRRPFRLQPVTRSGAPPDPVGVGFSPGELLRMATVPSKGR